MKVYLVTTGEYSDYQVRGVFSTMEKAEAARLIHAPDMSEANDIEVFELDATIDHPEGTFVYVVWMFKNGNVDLVYKASPFDNHTDNYFVNDGKFCVWARDEEHAIKVANERRGMLIATNKWK